jgi:hypothetical protein
MAAAPLSARQAAACENATQAKCTCRCGGTMHGARRGKVRDLPPNDPHRPDDEAPAERRRREKREAQERLWAIRAALATTEPTP